MPSRRLDETYGKVHGDWRYIYHAVDRNGQTLDFKFLGHRDETAVLRFFAKAVSSNGLPRACRIDKIGANTAGLDRLNIALKKVRAPRKFKVYRSKLLYNIVEQDHRGIRRRKNP